MSEDGVLVAIVPIRRANSQVAGDIDIISRGFVYQKENQDLIRDARKQVLMCLQGLKGPATDWGFMRKNRGPARAVRLQNHRASPLIIVNLIEV